MLVNRPVAFPGTAEEAAANRATHDFWDAFGDGEVRCTYCDARPSYVAASYPCGTEPPREEVTV